MKYIYAIAVLCCCNAAMAQSAAQTPPMGWNSYNCFGSAVHEDEVKANADYVAQNLEPYGWQYIVVDFLWSYDNPPGSNIGNSFQKNLQDGSPSSSQGLRHGTLRCHMPQKDAGSSARDPAETAKTFFDALNKANKFAIAWRLQTAKKPETREKRINMILEMLAKGEKFH